MFCTSLRRRNSFAPIIPFLSSPPLPLRESQLGTHDIEIPLQPSTQSQVNGPQPGRCLRVLLISPTGVDEARLETTFQRIRHFAALTGGQDLVIVLLLNAPVETGTASSKALKPSSTNGDNCMDGVYALSQLQAHLINHAEIPHIPVLPLYKSQGIKGLLKKHISSLTHPLQLTPPVLTSLELLQQCTANPPMAVHTANVLSDLFPSLKQLATACSNVLSMPNSSSLPGRGSAPSSQNVAGNTADFEANTPCDHSMADHRLQMLRDVIEDQEYQGVVDFWKDEWTID